MNYDLFAKIKHDCLWRDKSGKYEQCTAMPPEHNRRTCYPVNCQLLRLADKIIKHLSNKGAYHKHGDWPLGEKSINLRTE